MLVELCLATVLQTGISLSKGTVGILGYKQSLMGNAVVEIHPGSPVEGLLQKGDRIMAVDGNFNCHQTRGEPGTRITLTVKRGGKLFDVTVRRIAVQDLHNAYLCHYFGVRE
jgi:C-terminal processing protease CtpA/Prc